MSYKANEEQVSIRLPAALMRSLEKAAKKNKVSMSEAFRWAVQVVYYNPRAQEMFEDMGGGDLPAELFMPELSKYLEGIIEHNREVNAMLSARLLEVNRLVEEFRVKAELFRAERYGQKRLPLANLPRKSRAKAAG